MKKLEKLTLKELGVSMEVLDRRESIGLKGGGVNGESAYFCIYGEKLPEGTSYDAVNDVCYPSSDLGPSNNVTGTYTTTSVCSSCNSYEQSAIYGSLSSAGSAGQALLNFEYLMHSLGAHENSIITQTTYTP